MKDVKEYIQSAREAINEKIEELTIELNDKMIVALFLDEKMKDIKADIQALNEKINCLKDKDKIIRGEL